MTLTMYGIKNCDTVKKARAWLDSAGISYDFHDFKTKGAEMATVASWVEAKGWEVVLNRAGTTFRALPETDKTAIDADKAIALMVANPSMVKRPVLEGPSVLLVGFKPELYASLQRQA